MFPAYWSIDLLPLVTVILSSITIQIIIGSVSCNIHFNDLHQERHSCTDQSFALYDGFRFEIDPNFNTIYERHLESDNLDQCLDQCMMNRQCRGVNYDGINCRMVEDEQVDLGRLVRSDGDDRRRSFDVYAQKICITDLNERCRDRVWAFELIPGYHLHVNQQHSNKMVNDFFQRRLIRDVQSPNQCGQLCLNHNDQTNDDFVCRSALYNSTDCWLTNMNRNTIDVTYRDQTPSILTLNRHSLIRFESASNDSVLYIENMCINEPKNFCDFRQLRNHRLKTMDSIFRNVSNMGECRELCLSNHGHCRSFDYDSDTEICRQSHLTELTAWHIKKPYLERNGHHSYEISTCYNVSISCEPKLMKVHIETSKLFNGKIYAKSRPKNCVNDVTNRLYFDLSLPYIDTITTKRVDGFNGSSNGLECGSRQADPGNFANDIVIQHHDMVLTTKDLSLGVYCKFDLQNDSVARIDLKIQGDIMTDKLKGSAKLPELSLHVVDSLGEDIDEVSIGDLLRVQIRMSDETTYGIFVRNLIAKDISNRTNNFTLIDNKGCPVQLKMMREVRTLGDGKKSLESYLEAFTFTGGTWLVIEAEVETCLDKCRPMQCQIATGRSNDNIETLISYGRRRRRRSITTDIDQAEDGDILSMTMLSKSLLIRATRSTTNDDNENKSKSTTIPDGFNLKPPIHRSHRFKSNSIQRQSSLVQTTLSSSPTSAYRSTITKTKHICFEPSGLLLIGLLIFGIQGIAFTIILLFVRRKVINDCRQKMFNPMNSSSSSISRFPIRPQYSFIR
ncbi:hypothetical protein BLOT_000728 [Blomia tropicalis]|nr:hypothetical protein BLOT_000728 [Blomia tropicalis]